MAGERIVSNLMPDSWQQTTLGNVAEFINGDRGKNYPSSTDRVDSGIPFINTGHIEPSGRLSDNRMDYITRERFELLGSGKVRQGDIVYCLRGSTIGKTARNHFSEGAIASSLAIVRAKPTANQDFLYYFLVSPAGQQLAKENDNGSAQPNLSVKSLSQYPLFLPPIDQQKAIAHILGSLDDKIELNRQMNNTLEAMAQALFKSWFVDFDPVIDNALAAGNTIPEPLQARAEVRTALGDQRKSLPEAIQKQFPDRFVFNDDMGWVPEGWKVSSIGEQCDFQNGYAFKSKDLFDSSENALPVFKMGNIKRGGGFNPDGTKSYFPKSLKHKVERYLLTKGDILMSMTDMKSNMALLGHTALMPESNKFLLNQRVGCIRPNTKSYLKYPYVYIFSNLPSTIKSLRSRANSGVQVNLSTEEIKKTLMLIPSNPLHDYFDAQAFDLYEKQFLNDKENYCLAKKRDTLLPKLLSGQLRIPGAEQQVAEAS